MQKDKTSKKQSFEYENLAFEYVLKVSKKARGMRIAVYHDGRVLVTVPRYLNFNYLIRKFIIQNANWIIEKQERFKSLGLKSIIKSTKADYIKNKVKAQKLAIEKIEKFNKIYDFEYKNISIKNQKTRWGSCSKRGNLNFNYKIALIDEKLADYIIVHEICHLGELNHSKRFWDLVAKAMPDYKELKRELNKVGINYQ